MTAEIKITINPDVDESVIVRFLDKVEVPADIEDRLTCWCWQGAKHSRTRGYGKFRIGNKVLNAHKASYILFRGEVATGLVIGHQCNNEACVSPWHLKAETQQQNMEYCVASGRHNSQK